MPGKGKHAGTTLFIIILFSWVTTLMGQEVTRLADYDSLALKLVKVVDNDTIPVSQSAILDFTVDSAVDFLKRWYSDNNIWKNSNDPLRMAIARLIFEATSDPYYNSKQFLGDYDWTTIKIPSRSFFEWDTVHIPLKGRSSIQAGNKGLTVDTLVTIIDTAMQPFGDTSKIMTTDSSTVVIADTTELFKVDTLDIIPAGDMEVLINDSLPTFHDKELGIVLPGNENDSIILVIRDTLREVFSSNPEFPFRYYNFPNTGDSIQQAIDLLFNYTRDKDTSMITFVGSDNNTPVLMSNNSNILSRLRLRNEWDEELSVWVGSQSPDTVFVMVESGVRFTRPDKTTNIAEARMEVKTVDNSTLAALKTVVIEPIYWKFFSEAAFIFNQAIIKNWVKGGESNISTTLDLTGTANYDNKEKKISWSSQGRIKFGIMASTDYGVRKNTDQLDLVSKFNQKAFGKFDFSATMLFKTQLAFGYKYLPDTSYIVSKFFNPASITVGLGLDFKPNKNTSINFAPLSYKATFVPDTVMIDQTKHGLKAGQRSKHEPGISCQINHKFTFWKDVTVINNLQLFTNYIDHPQNIDIDWELIATAKLNWFTEVRLNTHLIYDDNTLIPVTNEDNEPVLGSDGKQKKVPMVQFKEVIGFSILFRF